MTAEDVSLCENTQLSWEKCLLGLVLNFKFGSVDKFSKLYVEDA